MMSKEKRRVPKLRFPGFTEDWEQRKFGEIMTFLNGRAYKQDELLEDGKYKVLRVGNFYTNDSWYYSDLELDDKYYAINGDLLYTWSATFGPHIWKGEKVIYHYHIWKLVLQDKIDKLFALQLLEVDKANIMSDKNGSTMVHITKQGMENKQTILPISLNEQKQIAKFLSSMDKLITLHQRKLDNIKLKKKALLQKLFPKNGERYPELRFPGFTDAWEQRKLNDFGIATGGTSIESEFVDGGTYKVINIGSYSEESVYNDQGLRVNKTDKTKSRILNKYDLTMILNDKTASGNIIGRVLLIDQDNTYVYNQRTERIEVDTKNFLPMFLYHMLNAPEQRKYIVKASQGNTQIYVNWSTISNIDYMIPQLLLEQEKIANLFSLINKDITLHQRKLDCLISIKKGLLQQLFV